MRSGSCAAAAITAGAVALMLEWQLYERKMPGIDVFQIKSLLFLEPSDQTVWNTLTVNGDTDN